MENSDEFPTFQSSNNNNNSVYFFQDMTLSALIKISNLGQVKNYVGPAGNKSFLW